MRTTAMLKRLLHDETGATAIEYGLIVAMIAIALIAALQATGNSFSGTLNKAGSTMDGAN